MTDLRNLMREFRFEEAAALARQALDAGEDGWMESARMLVRERPFFPNRQRAVESEVFFSAVLEGLRRRGVAEEDPLLLAAARENLVSLWTSIGEYEKVIPVREAQYEEARRTLAFDDAALLLARDNLAILYRNAGRAASAAALYADTGLCEHLAPLLAKLLADGASVVSCCRPWSANCHIWVYVDRVIDVAGVEDPALAVHEHRGTHDGSERGLVCRVHEDGLMGVIGRD